MAGYDGAVAKHLDKLNNPPQVFVRPDCYYEEERGVND